MSISHKDKIFLPFETNINIVLKNEEGKQMGDVSLQTHKGSCLSQVLGRKRRLMGSEGMSSVRVFGATVGAPSSGSTR